MAMNDLPSIVLNEIETKDLLQQEAWFEILDRFKELNISLPEKIDLKKPKDSDYFLSKAHLTVHSALSRGLQEHSNRRIAEYTSQLKDVFQKADEWGNALFEKQDKTLQALQGEMIPQHQSLEASLAALNKMNEESKHLVSTVSSIQDREMIHEKTEQRISEVLPEKGLHS